MWGHRAVHAHTHIRTPFTLDCPPHACLLFVARVSALEPSVDTAWLLLFLVNMSRLRACMVAHAPCFQCPERPTCLAAVVPIRFLRRPCLSPGACGQRVCMHRGPPGLGWTWVYPPCGSWYGATSWLCATLRSRRCWPCRSVAALPLGVVIGPWCLVPPSRHPCASSAPAGIPPIRAALVGCVLRPLSVAGCLVCSTLLHLPLVPVFRTLLCPSVLWPAPGAPRCWVCDTSPTAVCRVFIGIPVLSCGAVDRCMAPSRFRRLRKPSL